VTVTFVVTVLPERTGFETVIGELAVPSVRVAVGVPEPPVPDAPEGPASAAAARVNDTV
jgi:hypothetical protein